MNNRMIVYMIGRMLGVEGLLLLVPAFVSFLYGEQSGIAFLLTAAILLIIFLLAGRKKPKDTSIYGKEGLALVGIAWILWSLFGALPFFISAPIPHLVFYFFIISISTNTLIINPLKLLIKPISIQLYLQPFHYVRKQSYTSTHICNIKSKYINLSRIVDILITTKL